MWMWHAFETLVGAKRIGRFTKMRGEMEELGPFALLDNGLRLSSRGKGLVHLLGVPTILGEIRRVLKHRIKVMRVATSENSGEKGWILGGHSMVSSFRTLVYHLDDHLHHLHIRHEGNPHT